MNGVSLSTALYGMDLIFGIDDALFQGGGAGFPAALIRGGVFDDESDAGVFALRADRAPSDGSGGSAFGFRCARNR
jgi:hypothetical protein